MMSKKQKKEGKNIMESLEAELLLVTQTRNHGNKKYSSDGSESGDEFDGVSDSDGGEDEDPTLNDVGEEDDDDDDEYGTDDDDDDDYGSKRDQKKAPRQSKPKKGSKSSKSRGRYSDKKLSKGKHTLATDDEDQHFHFKYDENGYGDVSDRERLSRMSEVDRENLLSKRQDERSDALYLWQKKNEMKARGADDQSDLTPKRARSSGRAKPSSKSDALQALAEDKRKKSSKAPGLDVSDADSEQDRPPEKEREVKAKDDILEDKEEDRLLRMDGPDLNYKDLVTIGTDSAARTSPLFLRRDTLFQLSQQPFFGRVVQGLYVRLNVSNRHTTSYLLCRIAGVHSGKIYNLMDSGLRTNQRLLLQSGKSRCPYEINLLSLSHPTEGEFNVYLERARQGGIEIPGREEVKRLLEHANKYIVERKVSATEEETKKHMANMEIVYPERVNWTQKRTEIETALEIERQELINARDRGDEALAMKFADKIEEMDAKLNEVRQLESKYVFQGKKSNVQVFRNLAERNKKLNAANESLAASRRNFESNKATIDLYSRFDATGQSYFTIGADEDTGPMSEQAKDIYTGYDWRKDLVTWDPDTKRQKISDAPTDPAFGVPLPAIDEFVVDFSKPIEPRRAVSLTPPGLDAIYDRKPKLLSHPPSGAKILSFEEWVKQRAV